MLVIIEIIFPTQIQSNPIKSNQIKTKTKSKPNQIKTKQDLRGEKKGRISKGQTVKFKEIEFVRIGVCV
jgi:hypothetical protein